jgi:ParB family chromosome partitioning protein
MGRELLLIDPDPAVADAVRRAFASAGYEVTALAAGEPAVERCKQSRPDLILLAAELPDMSGFSVCNRLKRASASIPLILYTSEATDGAIEAHRKTKTRADAYLRQPLDLGAVAAEAAKLVKAPEGAPPPPLPRAAPAANGGNGAAAAHTGGPTAPPPLRPAAKPAAPSPAAPAPARPRPAPRSRQCSPSGRAIRRRRAARRRRRSSSSGSACG